MEKTEHLSSADFEALLFEDQRDRDETHVESCEACSGFLNFLKHAKQMAAGASGGNTIMSLADDHISDYIVRIYAHSMGEQEAADYLRSIFTSRKFFESTFEFLEDAVRHVSKAEQEQLAGLSQLSFADAVRKVYAGDGDGDAEETAESAEVVQNRIKRFFERLLQWVSARTSGNEPLAWPALPQLASLAFVFAIMIAAGSFLLTDNHKNNLDMYVYDKKVPFAYEGAGFRGESTNEPSVEVQRLDQQFGYAMGDYVLRNYERTVSRLSSLQPTLVTLESQGLDSLMSIRVRDCYFYLGVSQIALARSQTRELKEEERNEFLGSAIESLSQAHAVVVDHNLTRRDREVFFLGLAYGLHNDRSRAREFLGQIYPMSAYAYESRELAEFWSD